MLQENSSELIERAHRAGTTEEDGPTDSWLRELRDKKAEERAFTLTGKKKKGMDKFKDLKINEEDKIIKEEKKARKSNKGKKYNKKKFDYALYICFILLI